MVTPENILQLSNLLNGYKHSATSRSHSLPLKEVPLTIIGLGGIGSWVAYLASYYSSGTIYLIDHDIVEIHNLERTPYKWDHVGLPKVEAMALLITERFPGAKIKTFNKKIEDISFFLYNKLTQNIVLDCRDNTRPLPEKFMEKLICNNLPLIKLGYDGLNWNIIFNPDYEALEDWDRTEGYQIVPSAIHPPTLLASLILYILQTTPLHDIINRRDIIGGDMQSLFNLVLEKFNLTNKGGEINEK